MKAAIILSFLLTIASLPGNKKSRIGIGDNTPPGAKKLIACYPDFVTGYAGNYLLFKDGSKLLWDDGTAGKNNEQLLDKPDLKDMFTQPYPAGEAAAPAKNFDPGRIRNEAFFEKMYGSTKAAVEKNLVEITWCPKTVGQKIRFTKVNGADKQLLKVSAELDQHPELKKYLSNIGGTFNWRYIAGSRRQSLHSFGMTIDVNVKYADYWEWNCKCTDENVRIEYKNRIPAIIISTFEKHGFIWGGKWYHYDTMHFEYRPELLE